MKRFITLALVVLLIVGTALPALADGEEKKAIKGKQQLYLNEKAVELSSYIIDDENYVKLRDMAAVLKDTKSGFSVAYHHEEKVIVLVPGETYEPVEEDLAALADGEVKAVKSRPKLQLKTTEELQPVAIQGYNIEGHNYYRIRDLALVLDFGIDYDHSRKAVLIEAESAKPEEPETVTIPPIEGVDMAGEFATKWDDGEGQPEIVVFGHDECPHCVSLKAFLAEHNITYTFKNTRTGKGVRAEYDKLGYHYVPVIIMGPYMMEGFSEEQIMATMESCQRLAEKTNQ